MGLWQGFKSIFVGEDEIEQEEYAAYRKPEKREPVNNAGYEPPRYEAPKAAEEEVRRPEPERVSRPAQQPERTRQPAPSANSRQQPQNDARSSYSRNNNNNNQRERELEMSTTTQSSFDLVLSRPNNFRDVNLIGDDLNAGKTVILNLEKVKQEEATRIIDFLSGVAYANHAEFKMLANKTYAIVPETVNFSGVNLINELENNGYNF
ncbi:MAG: cell division protein SepF [Oscillospiraceae bacterium]